MADVTLPTDITTYCGDSRPGIRTYDLVMSWAYQRMLAIAAGFAAKERMPTEPASLLNEAYLRLRRIRNMQRHYRHHFFSVAQKREGSQRRVPMSDDLSWVDVRG
jgi:hypothetical protein